MSARASRVSLLNDVLSFLGCCPSERPLGWGESQSAAGAPRPGPVRGDQRGGSGRRCAWWSRAADYLDRPYNGATRTGAVAGRIRAPASIGRAHSLRAAHREALALKPSHNFPGGRLVVQDEAFIENDRLEAVAAETRFGDHARLGRHDLLRAKLPQAVTAERQAHDFERERGTAVFEPARKIAPEHVTDVKRHGVRRKAPRA